MSARAEIITDRPETGGAEPSFADLLRDLGDSDDDIPDYKSEPAAAIRYVYDGWVKRGGYERGKPRHSARQIKAWLGSEQIRSLETKLAGKTWLQFEDASTLLRLMLTKWHYDETRNKYTPFVPDSEMVNSVKSILQDLLPRDSKALLLPDRSRKSGGTDSGEAAESAGPLSVLETTMRSGETLLSLLEESDASVNVSRARAVLGTDPPTVMTGFHNLMGGFYDIAMKTKRGQVLLWILDLGLRNDKIPARGAIYNVYFLIAQFRAIALIERDGRESFYEWLRQNVCIVIGSLTHNEIDRIYRAAGLDVAEIRVDTRWFQADRLFLESVPGRWLDTEGSEAFGRSQRELWASPTITVHLKLDDWDLKHSRDVDTRKNLRYLFHGEVELPKNASDDEPKVRCISLPEPGSRWSDAYRLAIEAALGRLNRSPGKATLSAVSPLEALALLRSQNFAALRLDEFLHLADQLIDFEGAPADQGQRS